LQGHLGGEKEGKRNMTTVGGGGEIKSDKHFKKNHWMASELAIA